MKEVEEYSCPVEATIDIIGGKWKLWIIWCLRDSVLRFSELQKEMPGVSPKVLTKQLRELEGRGIVLRKIYPEIPPKVEYSLTPLGRTTIPIVDALCEWGKEYINKSCARD
jgi:DNA-binding HxlR family transcriptional regulator